MKSAAYIAALPLIFSLQAAELAAPPVEPATAKPAPAVVKPVIIDVRSQEEWDQGHIEGAVRITHTEIAEKIAGTVKDKSTPITLYCRSGRRAGQAKAELEKLGYTKVENAGGYEELKKKMAGEGAKPRSP
jgi:phage shock protein E